MNNYILLNGLKYATPAKSWEPLNTKPMTTRVTLEGKPDATYGPASIKEFKGEIEAPIQSDAGWGNAAQLKAVVATMGSVSFTDHLGNAYTVAIMGPNSERYLTPMWDAPSNKVRISVRLIIEAVL